MEHDILKSVNLFNRENLKPTDTFEEKQHGREKCSSRRPRSGQGAARARVAQRGRGFRQIGAEKGRNRGEELSP